MPPSSLTRAGVAPTPPAGPTTQASLAAMVIGVVIAALSLFDVVPTEADVQNIGVIVGALIALVPYVTMAISRTKQANNLAKLAQGERLANPPTFGVATHAIDEGSPVMAVGRAGVFTGTRVTYGDDEPEPEAPLGLPRDAELEVEHGSVRPPGVDVGGEGEVQP